MVGVRLGGMVVRPGGLVVMVILRLGWKVAGKGVTLDNQTCVTSSPQTRGVVEDSGSCLVPVADWSLLGRTLGCMGEAVVVRVGTETFSLSLMGVVVLVVVAGRTVVLVLVLVLVLGGLVVVAGVSRVVECSSS